MNENRFLNTMIETVKYGDGEYEANKSELLSILRNSMVRYNKTSGFTRINNQRWEYIDLRVPIPMLKNARSFEEIFSSLIGEVYISTDEYDFAGINIKPKPVDLDDENAPEHDVVFDEIKDTIIQGIRGASYIIWIAVAWFTDRDIFNELLLRKNAGVSIRIITSDEESNRYLIDDLEKEYETAKIPKCNWNRFHDKFCIIDLEYVMHGSYNWSRNAQGNDETWATALDRDFVKKFADEFLSLWNENRN